MAPTRKVGRLARCASSAPRRQAATPFRLRTNRTEPGRPSGGHPGGRGHPHSTTEPQLVFDWPAIGLRLNFDWQGFDLRDCTSWLTLEATATDPAPAASGDRKESRPRGPRRLELDPLEKELFRDTFSASCWIRAMPCRAVAEPLLGVVVPAHYSYPHTSVLSSSLLLHNVMHHENGSSVGRFGVLVYIGLSVGQVIWLWYLVKPPVNDGKGFAGSTTHSPTAAVAHGTKESHERQQSKRHSHFILIASSSQSRTEPSPFAASCPSQLMVPGRSSPSTGRIK